MGWPEVAEAGAAAETSFLRSGVIEVGWLDDMEASMRRTFESQQPSVAVAKLLVDGQAKMMPQPVAGRLGEQARIGKAEENERHPQPRLDILRQPSEVIERRGDGFRLKEFEVWVIRSPESTRVRG